MTEDEEAVRKLVADWMAATRAGDTATVLELMADDAVFMVPGREPFGKDAFADAARSMQGIAMEGTNDIVELRVMGDWAYLRARIAIAVTPPGGKPVRRSGYTLTVLHKEADGRWRLKRDANLMTASE